MQIWPAIDLIEGSCVRLSQGDFSRRTSYGSSPADMASRWVSEGASGLHIIDLDAATTGTSSNMSAIGQIIAQNDVDLQVGGGIRTKECVEAYLELGAQRLVISTQAVEDCKWVEHAAHKYPEHLIVSIDAKNGKVARQTFQAKCPIYCALSFPYLETHNNTRYNCRINNGI